MRFDSCGMTNRFAGLSGSARSDISFKDWKRLLMASINSCLLGMRCIMLLGEYIPQIESMEMDDSRDGGRLEVAETGSGVSRW